MRKKLEHLYEGMLNTERGLVQLSQQFSALRIELSELQRNCDEPGKGEKINKAAAHEDPVLVRRLKQLTSRELAVLRGIARGRKNRELADAWGVSVRTVESHRAGMFDKLQVHHVIELGPYISRLEELVDPPE